MNPEHRFIDPAWVNLVIGASTDCLDSLALPAQVGLNGLSPAMVLTWLLHDELRQNIDLGKGADRSTLIGWCRRASKADLAWWQRLPRELKRLSRRLNFAANDERSSQPGANLIGYGRGVLGMGEHVRMVAQAMAAAQVPYGLVDFTPGLGKRIGPKDLQLNWQTSYACRCNLLHVNADQMSKAYWHMGPAAFRNRYSIGYWAWELAEFPEAWRPAMGFVDELWAPSRFVQKALAEKTEKPVIHMPLCVELPLFDRLPRHAFGLKQDDFVFVFAFDCNSFIERKNPMGIVKAFQQAFAPNETVHLVIKTMNAQAAPNEWSKLVDAAATDRRISLINATWPRDRILALVQTADCYVSLHRSEGFGRGPAEAMLLGKPVIVTDYSGTQDYCNPDNALLVKAQLTPVRETAYPFAEGQVWADPDIGQAASHMRALFLQQDLGFKLGQAGQTTIRCNFSPEIIGKRYSARLRTLGMI